MTDQELKALAERTAKDVRREAYSPGSYGAYLEVAQEVQEWIAASLIARSGKGEG